MENFIEILEFLKCPIIKLLMDDPVIASDGHSYERFAILDLLTGENPISPMTGKEFLNKNILENRTLKNVISSFTEKIAPEQRQKINQSREEKLNSFKKITPTFTDIINKSAQKKTCNKEKESDILNLKNKIKLIEQSVQIMQERLEKHSPKTTSPNVNSSNNSKDNNKNNIVIEEVVSNSNFCLITDSDNLITNCISNENQSVNTSHNDLLSLNEAEQLYSNNEINNLINFNNKAFEGQTQHFITKNNSKTTFNSNCAGRKTENNKKNPDYFSNNYEENEENFFNINAIEDYNKIPENQSNIKNTGNLNVFSNNINNTINNFNENQVSNTKSNNKFNINLNSNENSISSSAFEENKKTTKFTTIVTKKINIK